MVRTDSALDIEGTAQSDDPRDGSPVHHKGGKALVVWPYGTWSVFQEAPQENKEGFRD